MNQGSNFLRSTFNKRDNVRESQPNLEEKVNPRILKDDFFLKERPLHFSTESTSVVRMAKQNQLNFSSIEIKPLPAPLYSVY